MAMNSQVRATTLAPRVDSARSNVGPAARPLPKGATVILPCPVMAAVVAAVRNPSLPDLTMRQAAVLAVLQTSTPDRSAVRHIAAELRVSKPAVTRALDRLETLALATRLPGINDRRDVFGALTPQGSAWLQAFAGTWAA